MSSLTKYAGLRTKQGCGSVSEATGCVQGWEAFTRRRRRLPWKSVVRFVPGRRYGWRRASYSVVLVFARELCGGGTETGRRYLRYLPRNLPLLCRWALSFCFWSSPSVLHCLAREGSRWWPCSAHGGTVLEGKGINYQTSPSFRGIKLGFDHRLIWLF